MQSLTQTGATLLTVVLMTGCGADVGPTANSAPGPGSLSDPAAMTTAAGELMAAPRLAVSDSSIGFCYHPGTTRNCVFLSERVRITSTVRPLYWRAASDRPWLHVSVSSGRTPAVVTISATLKEVPTTHFIAVRGTVTIRSAGASNSPLTIPVTLYFIAYRP